MEESAEGGTANETTTRLVALETKVNLLTDKDKAKTWYQDASTVISFVALLTSIVGFSYSSFRDASKDKDQRRADLQTAVSQLDTLTTQWTQLYVQYKSNPDYYTFIQPSIRAQIGVIGTKANTLLNSLGSEASGMDAAVVANALNTTADYATGAKLLKNALPHAKNTAEYLVIARMLGQFGFYRNNIDDGNAYFQLAKDVYQKFPDTGVSQNDMIYTGAETEAFWAMSAAALSRCDLAKQHSLKIKEVLAGVTVPLMQQGMQSYLDQLLQPIATACP